MQLSCICQPVKSQEKGCGRDFPLCPQCRINNKATGSDWSRAELRRLLQEGDVRPAVALKMVMEKCNKQDGAKGKRKKKRLVLTTL